MKQETVSLNTIRAALSDAAPKIGRFEACVLLAHVLGSTREHLIAHDEQELTEQQRMTFDLFVNSRLAGMPVPYLTGRQEFYGRYFAVSEHVLIPRPDTEVIVEQALIVAPKAPSVLDLGTGSGCIALTLAKECPGARVTATDVSEEALSVARANAKALGAQADFRLGSWWSPVKDGETFDVIVSNPPYIRAGDEHLGALSFEPQAALTDGGDGLSCLREIISGAMAHLSKGGWLLTEHGYDQGEAAAEMFRSAGFAAVHTVKDYGGNDRVTLGRRAG